ncbi:MAG: VWA domain-containing protein, partial [Pseudomonadota bacterium]
MPEYKPLDLPETPRLAGNITHFARALRRAGLPIGPGRVLNAIEAVTAAGFTERRDFYWTLHACFVSKPEHRAVFAQVFRLYWRDPRYLEHMMAAMVPAIRGVQEDRTAQAAEKRAAEALLDGAGSDAELPEDQGGGTEIEIDASLTMSNEERLKTLDFEQMSTAEMAQAKAMLSRMELPVDPIVARRARAANRGRIDPARTLRAAMRRGGDLHDLRWKQPKLRYPNLVALCDISGSMSQYSRVVLHFLHTVSNAKGAGWARVHAFTFGTRLTNITR